MSSVQLFWKQYYRYRCENEAFEAVQFVTGASSMMPWARFKSVASCLLVFSWTYSQNASFMSSAQLFWKQYYRYRCEKEAFEAVQFVTGASGMMPWARFKSVASCLLVFFMDL